MQTHFRRVRDDGEVGEAYVFHRDGDTIDRLSVHGNYSRKVRQGPSLPAVGPQPAQRSEGPPPPWARTPRRSRTADRNIRIAA